jgi:HK97 family phage portal protein
MTMAPILSNTIQRVRRSGPNPMLRAEGAGWNWNMRSIAGAEVTDESALGLTAFYRGVILIASSIAALPLHIYGKTEDGSREVIETPQTAYLWDRPNDEMTRVTFWEHVLADEVRGNGYIWVDKNANGEPIDIWYLDRHRVHVGRTTSGQKVYQVDGEIPMIDFKDGGEIIHIPNWGKGLVGYDPVRIAHEAISLGISAQEYAARFFSQDATPGGVITTDQPLSKEESNKIADSWHQRQSGQRNARRVAVLSNGAKFQQTTLNPEESQLQELRGFQGEEIARLLGIPPWMLGFTEKVTSFGAGLAEQSRGFVQFTLLPHIVRVEQAIDGALLVRELTQRYAKFDPDGLMRGTLMQRSQSYALGYGRWLTPNDIRRMEDMEPINGGDELPTASNLIPIQDLGSNFKETASTGG